MKDISENVMEINIELRLNVDKQLDDKTFKVKSDIDNSDEVLEITASRNPTKKKSLCLTCNQTLALKNVCKTTYRGREHWALGKFLWQKVQK